MKNTLPIGLGLLCLVCSCGSNSKMLTVTVKNPLNVGRSREMVEIPLADVLKNESAENAKTFKIVDAQKKEVAYQITYDHKVVFPVSVSSESESKFYISEGIPSKTDTLVCGRLYPNRMDDLAWENDLNGYRVYGPVLQQQGEKGFGYDLFAKRGTVKPVLPRMYELETNPENRKKLRQLQKTDKKAADKFYRYMSYHMDSGYGMDCYSVGPTLGAGVAALVENGQIVYPWCFKTYEILDNGPLRFTAKLVFAPARVNGNDVVETRLITLDVGSHLNRTQVSYANVKEPTPIVTGIVMHSPSKVTARSTEDGYIAYVDPTTGSDNGKIFVGHAFPNALKNTEVRYFSPQEKKMRKNAQGYVLSESEYLPGTTFDYYWGFAWDRTKNIKDFEEWLQYLKQYAKQLRNPLQVKVKGRKIK